MPLMPTYEARNQNLIFAREQVWSIRADIAVLSSDAPEYLALQARLDEALTSEHLARLWVEDWIQEHPEENRKCT